MTIKNSNWPEPKWAPAKTEVIIGERCSPEIRKHNDAVYKTNKLEFHQKIKQMNQVKQEPAVKEDGQKRRWSLLPVFPLNSVLNVFEWGAKKYGDHNWRAGMSWTRPFNACMRHLWSWLGGEDIDPESGLPHLSHAIASLLFLLEYYYTGIGLDDRNSTKDNEIADKIRQHVNEGLTFVKEFEKNQIKRDNTYGY